MTFEIADFDINAASEADLAALLEVVNDIDRELHPRHIDLTAEDFRMFSNNPGTEEMRLVVREGAELVATATFRHPDDGTNPDILQCSVRVLPEHRRRGIGTMLLRRAVEVADAKDRSELQGFVFDTAPAGHEFARAIGAEQQLEFHENVVRVDALDREMLQSWVDQGPKRAPGYSIRQVEVWPEEMLSDIAYLFHVLERDMPMSPSFEAREWNADRVRELQEHYADGVDAISVFAIHDQSGRPVGMTDMIRRKTDPSTWMVTVTMVDPDHRGRSLGKWIKGAANLAALERWEGGVYEETGNAFINEPMLAINHAMGFEHELTMTDMLLPVGRARSYLERLARPGASPEPR
jgi:GNAT superfamily N-acetyltransferase